MVTLGILVEFHDSAGVIGMWQQKGIVFFIRVRLDVTDKEIGGFTWQIEAKEGKYSFHGFDGFTA